MITNLTPVQLFISLITLFLFTLVVFLQILSSTDPVQSFRVWAGRVRRIDSRTVCDILVYVSRPKPCKCLFSTIWFLSSYLQEDKNWNLWYVWPSFQYQDSRLKLSFLLYNENIQFHSMSIIHMLDCRAQVLWGPLCVVGV